jgi:hypothetical protein
LLPIVNSYAGFTACIAVFLDYSPFKYTSVVTINVPKMAIRITVFLFPIWFVWLLYVLLAFTFAPEDVFTAPTWWVMSFIWWVVTVIAYACHDADLREKREQGTALRDISY